MSWDADLMDDRGHCEYETNYTHNCNGMIADAMERAGNERPPDAHPVLPIGPAWWRLMDGLAGKDGSDFLRPIIEQLEADPDHYRAMNPNNGWGNYDQLVTVLKEMRDAPLGLDWPTVWRLSG